MNPQQTTDFGRLDLTNGIKELEEFCLTSKKGNGKRIQLSKEITAVLQKQINLSAELAINVSREEHSTILKIVRGTIYLWAKALIEQGLTGEHNHYTAEQRALVAELDNPQVFWYQATAEYTACPCQT